MEHNKVIEFPSLPLATRLADEQKLAALRLKLATRIGTESDIAAARAEFEQAYPDISPEDEE